MNLLTSFSVTSTHIHATKVKIKFGVASDSRNQYQQKQDFLHKTQTNSFKMAAEYVYSNINKN